MNYLAHIFLSGDNRGIQIGNFVGDAVKGTNYRHYPERLQQGILLHRKIDVFSDSHPLVREAVGLGRPLLGRYSAVVMDIFFDHFLAANFRNYSDISLNYFAFAVLCVFAYLLSSFAFPFPGIFVAFYPDQSFGTLCFSEGHQTIFGNHGHLSWTTGGSFRSIRIFDIAL